MKQSIRNFFGLKKEYPVSFYLNDFIYRKILQNNKGVNWPVHFTSTVIFPQRITKGIHVFPGDSPGNYIQAVNGIIIGDHTNIGPNVSIISANHDPQNNKIHLASPPIIIGKHCWIGTGAVILPGVQLGDRTVVGAGAIVTKSFTEGHCIVAGNPAKIIRLIAKQGDLH